MDQYAGVSLGSFPAMRLDFMALDKSFNRVHVYTYYDDWVKNLIFERRLRARGKGYCFSNWRCVDVYAVTLLARLGMFVRDLDRWRSHECS